MHPQVKNYIFKVLNQKRKLENIRTHTQNPQILMIPSGGAGKSINMQEQYTCSKHSNSLIQYVCAFQACKQNRRMCQQCKQKQSLHFSCHSNYIFKLKQFFDFNQQKSVIPKLQKGTQDLQTYIIKHKQFYKDQITRINTDFEEIIRRFTEGTNQYKKIYLQNFEKEANLFDKQFVQIIQNLKKYKIEKNPREFLFGIFSSDKNSTDIEEIVQKNVIGFEVRANIITLKTKLTSSKQAKTIYKNSQAQQSKYKQLLGYLDSFSAAFYQKLKDLLVSNNQNSSTFVDSNNLKNSIASQTKSLSLSRVSLNSIQSNQVNPLRQSLEGQRKLVKCSLPDPHPKVLQIKQRLKPFPNFLQTSSKQQGPYKYQTGTYLGNYQNFLRSGKGIFVFDDGSYYQGSWQNDNMSGFGRLIKPNSYFEGDIRDGFAHGKGNFQDFQKTYSGEWRNDLRHGIGQEQFKNRNRKYIGSFINDKYEGKGKLFDQQFAYQGQFKGGFFDGEGLIKYKNGEIFKGSFKQNQRVFGKHTFSDGSYYEGTFRQNMPHGNGQYYWPDGIKYCGQWKNGQQQGIGIETLANGKQLKGFWQNGVWIKWL